MIHVIPLDFHNGKPVDEKLYAMACEYCLANMGAIKSTSEADELIRSVSKSWVSASINDAGEVETVNGITGVRNVPDIPYWRVTGEFADRSTLALRTRLNAYLADNGYRGREAFIFISDSELPEQRCSKWEEALKAAGATRAERYQVVVR